MKPPRLRLSVAQENAIARKFGGRRIAGSGSQVAAKGDVTMPEWLAEAKTTTTNRYALTLFVLRKIELEAQRRGKKPMLCVEMAGRRYCVFTEEDAHELLGNMEIHT